LSLATGSPRPIVVFTRRLPAGVERRAQELFDVRLNSTDVPLTVEQLADAVRTADALVPTVSDPVPASVLNTTPRRLKIIANYGVGYNNIDLAVAARLGIVVTNTPDVLTDDTADLTMALLLMTARRLSEGARELRAGNWTGWRPTHLLGTRVTGKTLGILGLGRIGRAVARRAHEGFGMRVIYFDPPAPIGEAKALGATPRASAEGVLSESDIVSLHMPASPENRHFMNAERLAMMRPHALLINTARGDIVDTDALVQALEAGTIAGAGLDVFENEPHVPPGLLALSNVVLLPHLGSATVESREAMGDRALANLTAFFAGSRPRDEVKLG
jgi:lactate dehydrogenase-like 2-hydroxyacid dehydrogenase